LRLVGFTIEKMKVDMSVIWLGCKAVMLVTIGNKGHGGTLFYPEDEN
jgi:hypothetical protein